MQAVKIRLAKYENCSIGITIGGLRGTLSSLLRIHFDFLYLLASLVASNRCARFLAKVNDLMGWITYRQFL